MKKNLTQFGEKFKISRKLIKTLQTFKESEKLKKMKKMFTPHWEQYTVDGRRFRGDLKIILANPSLMVTDLSIPQYRAEMVKE